MSTLSDLWGSFTGKPAQDAAAQNRQLYEQNYNRGVGFLGEGFTGAKDAYGNAIEAYGPLSNLARQFGLGTTMYSNALGLNGQPGIDAAKSAFQTSPGYDWMRNQALEASTRGAAARAGGSIGGNQLTALSNLGSNLANQQYGSWLDRLQGLSGQQLAAQGAASGGIAGQYGNLGNAYMTNATNLVNLGNTTTSGEAGANQQAAQAQMQGAQNVFGLGTSLVGAAASALGGMPPGSLGTAASFFGGARGAGPRVGPFGY